MIRTIGPSSSSSIIMIGYPKCSPDLCGRHAEGTHHQAAGQCRENWAHYRFLGGRTCWWSGHRSDARLPSDPAARSQCERIGTRRRRPISFRRPRIRCNTACRHPVSFQAAPLSSGVMLNEKTSSIVPVRIRFEFPARCVRSGPSRAGSIELLSSSARAVEAVVF